MGNSKLSSNQKLQDTGKLTETPETDAIVGQHYGWSPQAKFIIEHARSLERRLQSAIQGHNVCEGQLQDLKGRLREAEEQLRIAKEDAEIHLEAANRWSERAEAAERKLQGPVGAFDDDF